MRTTTTKGTWSGFMAAELGPRPSGPGPGRPGGGGGGGNLTVLTLNRPTQPGNAAGEVVRRWASPLQKTVNSQQATLLSVRVSAGGWHQDLKRRATLLSVRAGSGAAAQRVGGRRTGAWPEPNHATLLSAKSWVGWLAVRQRREFANTQRCCQRRSHASVGARRASPSLQPPVTVGG